MKGLELLGLNKTLVNCTICLFLGLVPISAMGQSMPYTFSANTAAKASEVNENFTYLLERFGVIRETTVNCGTSGTGSGINSAIQNGYNSIVINGICKENIKLDGTEGNIPRLLKLRGANNDASQDKIIDNSGYTEHVLAFNYGGMLVTIDNLTISGGDRGITTWMNINLRIRNSKVEGYKNRGITLQGGSVMEGENLTIDGSYSGATTDEQGLRMWGGAVAYVKNLTITNNQNFGLTMWLSDIEIKENVILTGNGRAINVGKGAAFTSNANINISGSTDRAISVSQGLFETWGGTISITNTSGNIFNAWMSNINIKNLTAIGDGSTAENLMQLDYSVSYLKNLSLSNSGKNGLQLNNSESSIDNLTSNNNKGDGISAWRSRISVKNSLISGNLDDGIELNSGSSLSLESSTISTNSDDGIEAYENNYIQVIDSTISNNNSEAIAYGEGSFLRIKDSTISGVSGENAISGSDNAILKITEDSGSTVISTTNNVSIRLSHNSSGQIRSGVQVTSTGTNGYGVQISTGGLINIESGATITGDSNYGSIDGILGAKIDIDYGATVQSVVCASDNQTIVILNGSSGNYPSPTIGANCITVKH